MKGFLLLALALAAFASVSATAHSATSDASLPKVLIIGDSISIGYTPYVAEMLQGDALVRHIAGNAQHTGTGLKKIDRWLGDTKWDVIYFNWGLWDFCYRSPESTDEAHRDKLHGTVAIPLKEYETNLNQLVNRLEKTGAKLLWASTTVVPEGEAGRFAGDDLKYNAVAAGIMKRHGIRIDDLNALTRGFPHELFRGPEDVHYTSAGYRKIAIQVGESIRNALQE